MASSVYSHSYAREPHHINAPKPPPINIRYFYTSPLAIDDPLSPLPPPAASSNTVYKQAPRPYSEFDNATIEREWLQVRRKLLAQLAVAKQEQAKQRSRAGTAHSVQLTSALGDLRKRSIRDINARYVSSGGSATNSPRIGPQRVPAGGDAQKRSVAGSASSSFRATDLGDGSLPNVDSSSITGNPFIRAPSRSDPKALESLSTSVKPRNASVRPTARPTVPPIDSYNWGEDSFGAERVQQSRNSSKVREPLTPKIQEEQKIEAQVPVGVSRLHSVSLPTLNMEPIYWMPVRDTAPVQRATWFYSDTMLPVETNVANLLELGYVEMQAWTDTWKDELDSAVDVGAAGEMKILHRLWPAKAKVKLPDKSSASIAADLATTQPNSPQVDSNDREQGEILKTANNLIDLSNSSEDVDNKAAGVTPWGRDGALRHYKSAGVIYANEKDAYILRPNLQPSDYYGRRPLANFIRKNKSIGISVVRGFDEVRWDKLYLKTKGARAKQAEQGVSTSEAGVSPLDRRRRDAALAASDRPEVTDLVLVIHGIGQKLSERMESYHFTHSINAFRREVNVELGDAKVMPNLRPDCGGIMVLPVNWRLTLSFEDGGYKEDDFASLGVDYSLKDITPSTLPSVRGIVSDVMLDIPYYLTPGYHDKMVTAVVREANRIYHLWCKNNPKFAKEGRVHVIAHSLGSVMAVDILSNQPTRVEFDKPVAKLSPEELPKSHFAFDVHDLFMAGSPAGFFLLLKRTGLVPRQGRNKVGFEDSSTEDDTNGVTGNQGTYGCLAVDNIYNIVNGYDPVAYCLNATVDAEYAAALKPAQVPSSSTSWFPSPFRRSSSSAVLQQKIAAANNNASSAHNTPTKPSLTNRLPSTVELETHDFTREDIAERKAYLLNDNGQIDYFLKYGGGPLEIQYLTMLGAHSSYWLSKDFVRMVVLEIGRPLGKAGTLVGMRAVKRKMLVTGGRAS